MEKLREIGALHVETMASAQREAARIAAEPIRLRSTPAGPLEADAVHRAGPLHDPLLQHAPHGETACPCFAGGGLTRLGVQPTSGSGARAQRLE